MEKLTPDQLSKVTDPATFSFQTTADLTPQSMIIGQPRGTRAIQFGIGMHSPGYNIFVLGETGTGRTTAIQQYLQQVVQRNDLPSDWVYVHNFKQPHRPDAIPLPAGTGAIFRTDMEKLIQDLRLALMPAFNSEAYQESLTAVQAQFSQERTQLLKTIEAEATQAGFMLVETPSGLGLAPMADGQPMSQAQLNNLPPEVQQQLITQQQVLGSQLESVLEELFRLEQAMRQQMKAVDRQVAERAVLPYFDRLQNQYQTNTEIVGYLENVHADVLEQIDLFVSPVNQPEAIDLRRYQINLLVDHRQTTAVPVVVETDPTYERLFGRLEYEMRNGILSTHFTLIKCGSLHQANGGYLILNGIDLLQNLDAWEALKRALQNEELVVPQNRGTGPVLAKSLDPEPIPLSVKVVLLGSPGLYYGLHERDDDFASLFKVRADFDTVMPRDEAGELAYAQFVAARCLEEKLRHFDAGAVADVIAFGSRQSEHQQRLSTRFGEIADLVREANYWAVLAEREHVTAVDVQQALSERTYRANRSEEWLQERIQEGSIFIATEGSIVGQVNGLSVMDTGEYAFGIPGRITARTFMGDNGIVHIERETDMSGPIHQKGVLTLTGYLGGTYAQDQPLSLSASLTFEQSYGGVDGDSASSTELYALLSSICQIPIKQGIAVTGSVNQRGEIQPIGGVNEKIEGFFQLCQARGLTGEQGVIIPASNMINLMLNEAVRTAVSEERFHIWAIDTVDQGIELLMGLPAGERDEDGGYPQDSVHHAVQSRLRQLAEELNKFGESDDDEEDQPSAEA